MGGPGKDYTTGKKPDTKDHRVYDSIDKNCPEPGNPQRQSIDEWLLRAGRRESGEFLR